MKILDSFAALERFELRRSVDSQLDPYVPEVIDVVHAGLLPEEPWTGTFERIADAGEAVFAEKGRFLEAACGRHIRVYLPEPFDTGHPKACQRCIDAIGVNG